VTGRQIPPHPTGVCRETSDRITLAPWFVLGSVGDAAVGGNVTIDGNLTVAGSTTTLNTENLTIQDSIIGLMRLVDTLLASLSLGITISAGPGSWSTA